MSTPLRVSTPPTVHPAAVGTVGTGLFPLWTDIESLSSKGTVLNPYALENSTSTTDAPSYALDVPPGWNWLDAYQFILNAGSSSILNITTALKGVFFGKFPISPLAELRSADPRALALTGWTGAFGQPSDPSGGIWLPLDNPVSGTTEFTFQSGAPVSPALFQDLAATTATYPNLGGQTSGTIARHFVSTRVSVYLGGATRVMFIPSQAAVISGSGSGLLLGRFVA